MSHFFGQAVHAAFVVTDIDEAVQRMLESGIGPSFLMRGIRVEGRYRGQRNDALISAAFLYSGAMQYEFVQQHDKTPSAYLEFLEHNPNGGLHHLAYFCNSFEEALNSAKKQGKEFQIVQEFINPDGTAYEMYIEPVNSTNPLLVQLMTGSPLQTMFDTMEQISTSWQGENPLRNALELLPEAMRPTTELTP